MIYSRLSPSGSEYPVLTLLFVREVVLWQIEQTAFCQQFLTLTSLWHIPVISRHRHFYPSSFVLYKMLLNSASVVQPLWESGMALEVDILRYTWSVSLVFMAQCLSAMCMVNCLCMIFIQKPQFFVLMDRCPDSQSALQCTYPHRRPSPVPGSFRPSAST